MYVAKNRKFKWKEAGFQSWDAYLKHQRKIYYKKWYAKNRAKHLENLKYYSWRRTELAKEKTYREWYEKTYLKK